MNSDPEYHPYGTSDLKQGFGRNLSFGLVVSLAIHGVLILLLMLGGEEGTGRSVVLLPPITPPPHDTVYTMIHLSAVDDPRPGHAGGGAPDVKAPPAPSSKGHPNAVPERSAARKDPNRTVVVKTPTNVRPVEREPKPVAGDPKPIDSSHTVTGTRGQNTRGEGDHPSGGSGGPGVGIGSASGMGSRGWQVRPRATFPSGVSATGTVRLRFTVMPNGDVVNITPVRRADQALVNAAVAGLRRAKARPLPPGVPQEPQTAEIPFTFELR